MRPLCARLWAPQCSDHKLLPCSSPCPCCRVARASLAVGPCGCALFGCSVRRLGCYNYRLKDGQAIRGRAESQMAPISLESSGRFGRAERGGLPSGWVKRPVGPCHPANGLYHHHDAAAAWTAAPGAAPARLGGGQLEVGALQAASSLQLTVQMTTKRSAAPGCLLRPQRPARPLPAAWRRTGCWRTRWRSSGSTQTGG